MNDTAPARLTICSTCVDTAKDGEEGIGGGSRLHDLVKDQLEHHPFRDRIELDTIRCLMACTNGCVLTITAQGKMQYVLAGLPARFELAEQVLDFVAMYDRSPTGITPNHEWPPLIGAHFLARIPPPDPVEADWSDDGCNL